MRQKVHKKWKEFLQRYKAHWGFIGIVQIPHHGSALNYNPNINYNYPKISVISAGKSNRFGHPDQSTLKDIILNGGIPFVCHRRLEK